MKVVTKDEKNERIELPICDGSRIDILDEGQHSIRIGHPDGRSVTIEIRAQGAFLRLELPQGADADTRGAAGGLVFCMPPASSEVGGALPIKLFPEGQSSKASPSPPTGESQVADGNPLCPNCAVMQWWIGDESPQKEIAWEDAD